MMSLFNKKDNLKEKEEKDKKFIKTIKTKELKNLIEEQKGFIKTASKIYDKRKDKCLSVRMGEEFWNLIDGGIMVFVLGLFMLGAIPSYFGVNDELINPSFEQNITLNESLEIVKDAGYNVIVDLHDIGVKNPKVFFWLFWLGVLYFMIIPIGKIVFYSIKKLQGGNKDGL